MIIVFLKKTHKFKHGLVGFRSGGKKRNDNIYKGTQSFGSSEKIKNTQIEATWCT